MVDRYLDTAGERPGAASDFRGQLYVMSSSGGTLTADMARRFPVRLLESGPAAGALMAAAHGRALGERDVLSFDMGGTTAKGCLIRDGAPLKRYELEVARMHEFKQGSGLPAQDPGDRHDRDRRRRRQSSPTSTSSACCASGPRSAGADPGPACYGRGGTQPTLTDANLRARLSRRGVVPRRDHGARPAAGARRRSQTRGRKPARRGCRCAPPGASTTSINEDVARAFRIHASERGFDYRHCTMIAFGGSGPLHALASRASCRSRAWSARGAPA